MKQNNKTNILLFIFVSIIFLLAPLITNAILSIENPLINIKGKVGDWISFFGNYFGGLIGAMIAFFIAKYQIDNDRKKQKIEEEGKQLNYLKTVVLYLNSVKLIIEVHISHIELQINNNSPGTQTFKYYTILGNELPCIISHWMALSNLSIIDIHTIMKISKILEDIKSLEKTRLHIESLLRKERENDLHLTIASKAIKLTFNINDNNHITFEKEIHELLLDEISERNKKIERFYEFLIETKGEIEEIADSIKF